MSDIRVKALNIRAQDYSEGDKLLTLITPERGKITAKIKGVKTPKSKLKYAASPLSFGEYFLVSRGGRYTVTGCDLKENFSGIIEDPVKYFAASVILEAVNKLTKENSDTGEILLNTLKILNMLSYEDYDEGIITLYGMLNLLKLSGYAVISNKCIICENSDIKYFSLKEGGTVCYTHYQKGDIRISKEAGELLKEITLNDIKNIKGDINTVKECLNLINLYFTYQTESVLKSLPQLIEIF